MFKKKTPAAPAETASDFKQSWTDKAQFNPTATTRRVLTNFDEWRASREWGTIALGLFPLLFLLTVIGMVIWGKTVASRGLLMTYVEAAEQAAPVKEDGTGANEVTAADEGDATTGTIPEQSEELKEKERQELTDYATLLFKRVLAVEKENKRARYYVAARLGEQGNMPVARSMMASLAPDTDSGYPAAHAWMAGSILQQLAAGAQSVDIKQLEHHLDIAANWGGTNPQLLLRRGAMLEKDGKINEALRMYSIAADRDPQFHLILADAFRRHNQRSRLQETTQRAISHYSRHLNTDRESDSDRLEIARAYLLLNEPDKAIAILDEGLRTRGTDNDYRRAISEVYRLSYLSTARIEGQQFQANLVLLDRAVEADPTNPQLGQEISRVTAMLAGNTITQETLDSLSDQIAAGAAPVVTHTLLANVFYIDKKVDEAILHWDLASKINDRFVPVLRSLALALAMKEEPDYERALELIDHAMEVSKDSLSVTDAKGDILRKMNRLEEAAKSYEAVLIQGPQSLQTRAKLVEVYDALNLPEKADREQATLDTLRKRIQEIEAQRAANAAKMNAEAELKNASDAPENVIDDAIPAEDNLNVAPGSTTESLNDLIRELETPAAQQDEQTPAATPE